MTSQPLAYSSSSSSNIKHTPGLALAGAAACSSAVVVKPLAEHGVAAEQWHLWCTGRRIQARTNSSKRRLSDLQEMEEPKLAKTSASGAGWLT